MGNFIRLPASDRDALVRLEHRLGAKGAAAMLEINVWTLTRALAGLGVQKSTAALIRMKLEAVTA